ncbi:hypothetical protein B0H10DRAFT_2043627 [Mycena sp. CBHHK59/15]|nr:hypothetical protein B0H10DRAFT_2043627 [Mycena sp. CBHHK59/15]
MGYDCSSLTLQVLQGEISFDTLNDPIEVGVRNCSPLHDLNQQQCKIDVERQTVYTKAS